MGEIAPEQDFTATLYDSDLEVRTLTWYYSSYLIPEGDVLSTPGDTRPFESPVGSIALYEQALMTDLRFLVPSFFRELLFFLGLAPGQLMLLADSHRMHDPMGVNLQGKHHLTLNEFFHYNYSKVYLLTWVPLGNLVGEIIDPELSKDELEELTAFIT